MNYKTVDIDDATHWIPLYDNHYENGIVDDKGLKLNKLYKLNYDKRHEEYDITGENGEIYAELWCIQKGVFIKAD